MSASRFGLPIIRLVAYRAALFFEAHILEPLNRGSGSLDLHADTWGLGFGVQGASLREQNRTFLLGGQYGAIALYERPFESLRRYCSSRL